jgi:hypothetical protein
LFVLVLFGFFTLNRTPESLFSRGVYGVTAANLHPGLLPFFGLWHFSTGLSQKAGKKWLFGLVLLILCLFITPYPMKIGAHLVEHLFYYQSRILGNPDHESFGLKQFELAYFGLTGYVWAILTMATAVLLVFCYRRTKDLKFADGLFTLTAFTIMALNRDRAVPFQVIAILPYLTLGLSRLQLDVKTLSLASVLSASLMALHLSLFSHHYKLALSPEAFPIEEAELLRSHPLKGNLLQTPSYGSFLLTFAPSYKVFLDTRETPFLDTQKLYVKALSSPEGMKAVVDELGVNIVLWPSSFPQPDGNSLIDPMRMYFPKKTWALCHSGVRSMLLVRRTPENKDFIREFELQDISPSGDPAIALTRPEVKRDTLKCLKSKYPNISCLLLAKILHLEFKKRDFYACDRSYLNLMEAFYAQRPGPYSAPIVQAAKGL